MWSRKRENDTGPEDSKKALEDAQLNLREIEDRHEEVIDLTDSLRKIRDADRFSEHIMRLMKEGHK